MLITLKDYIPMVSGLLFDPSLGPIVYASRHIKLTTREAKGIRPLRDMEAQIPAVLRLSLSRKSLVRGHGEGLCSCDPLRGKGPGTGAPQLCVSSWLRVRPASSRSYRVLRTQGACGPPTETLWGAGRQDPGSISEVGLGVAAGPFFTPYVS